MENQQVLRKPTGLGAPRWWFWASRYAGKAANATQHGLAFCTGDPAIVKLPLPASARKVTTVSDCSFVTQRSERPGSNPMYRGVRPCDGIQPAAVNKPVRGSDAKLAMLSCPRLEQ